FTTSSRSVKAASATIWRREVDPLARDTARATREADHIPYDAERRGPGFPQRHARRYATNHVLALLRHPEGGTHRLAVLEWGLRVRWVFLTVLAVAGTAYGVAIQAPRQ